MLGYRAVIMAAHPGQSVIQYALVLKDGVTPNCDDTAVGFALGYRTVYLRDAAPESLLQHATLSVFAAIAAGDNETRAAGLARALALIETLPPTRTVALREAATVLATIRLDPHTIDQIGKESGMTVETIADFYSETAAGRELINRGVGQGLEQGIQQGLVETLGAFIRDRFGDLPGVPEVARRLAHSGDLPAAVHAINHAATFEDLRDQ
jgi:hypothetical protein